MPDSYRSELADLIDRVYVERFGGRATAEQVRMAVAAVLPEGLSDYLIGKGLASEVGAYFRAKSNDGLPKAPEVNDDGEHVQLEFLSITEFAYLHSKYLDRSTANAEQAEKVRERCLSMHRVDLVKVVTSA